MIGMWQIETTGPVLAWLATYCVHSSILLATAWVAGRVLGERRLDMQEVLWRIALFGGVLTSTVQTTTGLVPFGGEFRVTDFVQVPGVASALEPDAPEAVFGPRMSEVGSGGVARHTDAAEGLPGVIESGCRAISSGGLETWSGLLVIGWGAGRSSSPGIREPARPGGDRPAEKRAS